MDALHDVPPASGLLLLYAGGGGFWRRALFLSVRCTIILREAANHHGGPVCPERVVVDFEVVARDVRAVLPVPPAVHVEAVAQGMIEHMSDSIANASMRIVHALHTPPEEMARMKSFALSEKEFRPNTKNALMSEEPALLRNNSMTEAILELEKEIKAFFDFYKSNVEHKEMNPFFSNKNTNTALAE